MKRRDFFGVPLALAGAGLASFAGGVAAATPGKGRLQTLNTLLMRLEGSEGSAADAALTGRRWQAEFDPSAGQVTRARLTLHGLVRAAGSSLGALDVEALYFGADGGVNSALVYVGAEDSLGACSKGIGFDASAQAFGGLQITPRGAARNASGCLCALGDNRTGALRPGLYALLAGMGGLPDPDEFTFSGYLDRPLIGLDGRLPGVDYLAFGIAAKA